MQKSTIIWNENQAPLSVYFDDIYFNTQGAVAETKYVFIEGNHLQQRFIQHDKDTFIIGETGFGSGLSFLIAWQTFLTFKKEYPNHQLQQLKFISIEKYPLSVTEMMKMHQAAIEDERQLQLLAKQLYAYLTDNTCHLDKVSLDVLYDDIQYFPEFLAKQNGLIDAWFFDGFSPAKNPDMWSESLFKSCFQYTSQKGTFATFSAAGFVRRNLINAGFNVIKQKGFGLKREMLIGSKK